MSLLIETYKYYFSIIYVSRFFIYSNEMTFLIKNRKFSMNVVVKLNKSIIPFDVIHKDLFSLYIGHFDNIFENNPDLSTFTK